MKRQYRSALMASVHETAEGLHAAGAMDMRTMREFDELCLTPVVPLKPKEIRGLRLREGPSQAVLARYLLSRSPRDLRISGARSMNAGLKTPSESQVPFSDAIGLKPAAS